MTPEGGLTRGGELVHIHGTDLLGAPLACPAVACSNYVKFGDAFGTIADNTATEIVVIAPPHAAGVVDVQVNIAGTPPITLPNAYSCTLFGHRSRQFARVDDTDGSSTVGPVTFQFGSTAPCTPPCP